MTRGDWKRVSKRRPCPVCGKEDWCLYAGPDDAPTAAICARIESAKPVGAAGSGWWHRLRDDDRRAGQTIRRVVPMRQQPQDAAGPDPDAGPLDFESLAADFRAAADTAALRGLAVNLGLSPESLQRLRVGWSRNHRAWSFPMRNAAGQVLGIRLRKPNGRKFSVTGGHDGLFLPDDLPDAAGGRLLICEGPTDCAALLDLGFSAVGRPSCTGGGRLLVELVRHRRPAEVCIIADGDAPGQRGAGNLAAVLLAYCPAVRIITPPAGIKDARAWKRRGATVADVQAVIDAAPVRRLAIVVSRQTRRKVGRRHGRTRS
jgi:phage/plasmid primase-like uncharacterized protein